MGARLCIRHRGARARFDAVRGTRMKDGAGVATASQTVGPFFHLGLRPQPTRQPDQAVTLALNVTDGDGQPVEDALIELWTSNGFARMATGEDGTCECEIARAPHIN